MSPCSSLSRFAWLSRVVFVLVTSMLVVAALGVVPAEAGVMWRWQVQPTGTATKSVPVVVQGMGTYDAYPFDISTISLSVDGAPVQRSKYTALITNTPGLYLYYLPAPRLSDGPHTFSVQLADTLGRVSAHQWSSTVAVPPDASWTAPASGSVGYTGRPVIGLVLSDNTPGTTFTVNGQVRSGSAKGTVVATFGGSGLAAGERTFALGSELAPGTYYLTATITDAAGCSRTLSGTAARSFRVTAAEPMSVFDSGCLNCHTGRDHPATTRTCEGCHTFVYHEYADCWDCHQSVHTGPVTVTGVTGDCTTCHNASAPDTPRHTPQNVDAAHASECGGCHAGSLIATHALVPEGSAYAYQCGLCHLTDDIRVRAAVAAEDTSCSACHDVDHVTVHETIVSATCSEVGCHNTGSNLTEFHADCNTCHASTDPIVVGAIGGGLKGCEDCHATADHESLHTTTVPPDCAGCHPGTTLTAGLHVGCDGCHKSTNPDVLAAIDANQLQCLACHTLQPHDLGDTHAATVTSGQMNVFDYHEGYSQLAWDLPCNLCHGSMDLLSIHGNDCAACHNGAKPAESFTVWNGGCSQGACHSTIQHPSPDSAHNELDCESCHEPNWYVYYGSCDACHNPSASAPVTTSDVKSAYTGTASIKLTAPGIAYTFYRINGGPRMSGSMAVVQGPASGTGNYTIEYWSVDDGGREELPHKTAGFTISADTTPPTTTSNAQPMRVGPTTITLSVTDNNSAPVTETYWRLNSGSAVSGRTILVPQPIIGEQSHTLEFWSVDPAGNEELPHKTVTFTVVADLTPPAGTININAGAAYTTATSVSLTLSASDLGGSGVSQMRFSNDNANWSTWQSPAGSRSWTLSSGNGTKTVYVQYRDNAGNVGTYSDSIVFDNVQPTGLISINGGASSTDVLGVALTLSATDTLSGMGTMRFSNGGSIWSAWEPYATTKSWTLAAGAGAKTVSVQFRDNAGNMRQYSGSIQLTATDATAPTGSVMVNAGAAYTNSTSASLTLSASDAGGSGLSDMRFSNDNSSWGAWEPYATSKSWTLPSGDGPKMVYVQYRDVVGNASTYADGIILDTVKPTGSIWISAGATLTNKTSVVLSLSASDPGGSGPSAMQFSNDAANWSDWEAYGTTASWTLTEGDGIKTVYARFRDGAGNLSAVYSDDIELDSDAVPLATTSLRTDIAWVDANPGATGPWATYSIYVNDVLVGTKPADSNGGWACPDIALPSGGHVDIKVDCGFTSLSWVYGQNTPRTYTLNLPAGTIALKASTWTGFAAMNAETMWWDDYEDYTAAVWVPAATISNISYVTGQFSDTTPPTGSIAINSGAASTNTAMVALQLSASDVGGSGVTSMQFSNNGTNWSAWESYATSKNWTLTSGDGQKTVYVRYRDASGNLSPVYTASILLQGSGTATLRFEWYPNGWADAQVRVKTSTGVVIAEQYLEGYGTDLYYSVAVPSGQDYYMECVYYYDDWTEDSGGPYGIWTSNTSINADGVLSSGETVVWYY